MSLVDVFLCGWLLSCLGVQCVLVGNSHSGDDGGRELVTLMTAYFLCAR